MPCYLPLQATFSLREDGKKDIKFSNANARAFCEGRKPLCDSNLSLPCGRCIGCRISYSRDWAVRCVAHADMFLNNSFITLTYQDSKLPVNGSLDYTHWVKFMKRLRKKFGRVRYYMCGEYGETFGRPHYHACLFNFDFSDTPKPKPFSLRQLKTLTS